MAARINARRYLWVLVVIMALFVSMVGVTALAQTDEGDVFTGCVNEASGVLSNVAVGLDPAKPCNPQESQITWDRAGPAFEERIAALEEQVAELEAPYGTLELMVDCAAAETVGAALAEAQTHPGPVNITISGVCEESVSVSRDDVSFQGTQRSDGIRAASGVPSVFMFDAQGIRFDNMTVSGGAIAADLGSTFVASNITVRDASHEGIGVFGGSSAKVDSCMLIDNARFGVHVNTEGIVEMSNCEITGSGETGLFAGGVGSATILVGNSEITNNRSGAGANPGGNLRLSNTLVEDNEFAGVFVIGGVLVLDGETSIVGNGIGVMLDTGSNAYSQVGPVVVEGNSGDGISVGGGSDFRGDDLIVRGNAGSGISIGDLSTVGVGPAAQITDNGGWGINCAGPPAVAVLGGQGLFNPSNIVFSGNGLGDTNCS